MANIPEDFTGVITFSKTTQPKQYESEKVEITVAISDGDDVDFSLDMIRRIAYNHLGVIASFTAYAEDMAIEAAAPEPVAEEKPKRKRRTQAEIKADKAREEAYKAGVAMTESGNDAEAVGAYEAAQNEADDARRAVVAEKVEAETPPAETASAPSVQEVADWAGKAAKRTTAGEVMQLMKDRFGVSRLGSIPEDKRADAIELLKAVALEEDDIPY